jgi:hypothetical protein
VTGGGRLQWLEDVADAYPQTGIVAPAMDEDRPAGVSSLSVRAAFEDDLCTHLIFRAEFGDGTVYMVSRECTP